MACYLVEQSFPDGIPWTAAEVGERRLQSFIPNAREHGITSLFCCISVDRRWVHFLCEAPAPEAIRRAAQENKLPVDRITEVWLWAPGRESERSEGSGE